MLRKHFLLFLLALLLAGPLAVTGRPPIGEVFAQALSGGPAASAPSNVRGTRHNLSSSAPSRQTTSGNASTTEAIVTAAVGQTNEVCVYCHTPHGASTSPGTPLWNRTLSSATYTPYSSSSLQASDLDVTAAALAAPSKLCLSCHDGTVALGNISNAPGSGLGSGIPLRNTTAGAGGSTTGTMPYGRGLSSDTHGFTRRIGTDLRNDHPISFTYDSTLASADGELRSPPGSSPTIIANRSSSVRPHFPLKDGRVQCSTCHDPHKETQKFLRKNRLAQNVGPQTTQSSYSDWSFSDADDQICVACHTRLGKAWAQSAHANSDVKSSSDYTYNAGDAAVRDFPTGTTVWQAGCLNCHDTHTVGGSRRLLREGVNTGMTGISQGYTANVRTGIDTSAEYDTTSALENTCYQCHSSSAVIAPTLLSATQGVPNIEAEFARSIRMPLVNAEQGLAGGNTVEVHDITDKDGNESRTLLGYLAKENRHVECSDCHNPHRVIKANTFIGQSGTATYRTHTPALGTNGEHGNIASGALRGTWGVEPSYTSTLLATGNQWMSAAENPTFTVKKGDPAGASSLPTGTAGTNSTAYLTREYQLCFKCHSNYANGPNATDFADLRPSGYGGTPSGTRGTGGSNLMTRYTDVAKEFAVRAKDPPEATGSDQGEDGNDPAYTPGNPNGAPNGAPQNHRSWHPVVFPTGRTMRERRNNTSNDFSNILAPFNDSNKVGKQTMHCSDCHGSQLAWQATTGVNTAQVQGPHGSSNPFLLKGPWVGPDASGGWDNTTTRLDTFSSHLCGNCHNPTGGAGGFSSGSEANHNSSKKNIRPCMWCHVAVPHGWRNKALLVNMNCVGPEGGGSGCQSNVIGDTANLTAPPYYIGARLRVKTWQTSTNWSENSCDFPTGSGGGDWMTSACGDI